MRNIALLLAAGLIGAATLAAPVTAQGVRQTVGIAKVESSTVASGFRASKVVGALVFNDSGDNIGKIDDVIVSSDGKAPYAVLSVGGFLGLGSKLVLVKYEALHFQDNKITLPGGTKDQLMSLPEF